MDIPLPRQILEHRRRSHPMTLRKRTLLAAWEHPRTARAAARAGALAGAVVPVAPVPLARRSFRAQVDTGGDGAPVTIFASCLVDLVTPEAGVALNRILRAAGYRVEFPESQWCCGLICANAGDFEKGARLNRRLVEDLAGSGGPIVTPSASCFGAVTMDAREWGSPASERDAVASRMWDSTRFLLELLEERPGLIQAPADPRPRVAYHDSCQTKRQLGLLAEPREVLRRAGYDVVDLHDTALCCGFGGTFSLDWPEVADRLVEWKLDAVRRTGCDILASDNPGCLMHIQAGARKRGLPLRVAHVLELVAEHLA